MNLNYSYVQDLSAEKLQCWFTPRVETKTHSDLPGTLNLEMHEQPVILQLPPATEAFLLGGRERHATLQKKKKTKESDAYFKVVLHFPPSLTWPQRAQWLFCAGTGSLFRMKSRHFYLGWEILKHIREVFLQGRKVHKWSFRKHSCNCVWEFTVKLTMIK